MSHRTVRETRQAALLASVLVPDVLAKRMKRHLDDLERSNYVEPGLLSGVAGPSSDDGSFKYTKGRARQLICDKRGGVKLAGNSPAANKKKKSTMSVRTALLYHKSLSTLIDESKIAAMPGPTYLTAASPPSAYPARMLCSVCGYFGHYRCLRCAMPFCDRNCESVHNETRCERRVV
ncbi:hypothetical protein FISHEDRAFT_67613 [Fistulina hepatica ATCC 64428]|nr:hypothetical protein FISHEDRAFT_67613 [Fistulina hepatica ATCC 64428]